MSTHKKIVGLAFMVIVLSGCATTLTNVKGDYRAGFDSTKTLVFGEVEFKDFRGQLHSTLFMNLLRTEDNKEYSINVSESSYWQHFISMGKNASVYLFIELSQGSYIIKGITMGDWQLWWPGVNFSVAENAPIIYIGTLSVSQAGKQSIWSSTVPIKLSIIDDYDAACEILNKKYPNIDNAVLSQIMKRQHLSCAAVLDSSEPLEPLEKEYGQRIIDKINKESYIYFGWLDEGQVAIDLKVNSKGKIV